MAGTGYLDLHTVDYGKASTISNLTARISNR